MAVKYSKLAHQHLADIWQYSFQSFGEKQADLYVSGLLAHCESLFLSESAIGVMPRSRPFPNETLRGVRMTRFRRHAIVFRYKQNSDVQVFAIYHLVSDIPRHITMDFLGSEDD